MMPTRGKFTILKQVMDIIPKHLVPKLSKVHGLDEKSRTFSVWSHLLAMIHCQLSCARSLNDVCDTLKNHASALSTIRDATPPSRNGLSHSNKVRSADMAEDLFWSILSGLKNQFPNFGNHSKKKFKLPRRFKRAINIVDSTTIQLVANCMDWAKHRRRKAAAKCHMRLDAQSFLPSFALVKSADSHDSKEAIELCADIKAGEIVIFDKAYIDFVHLSTLNQRGVFWVSRAKDNMAYKICKKRKVEKGSTIVSDFEIKLTTPKSADAYPERLRLVVADVEVDEKIIRMSFISNNLDWAPTSIADLYKARWNIEVFFKQIKQTLQLGSFMGYSENAVRWQVWTALLTYVLLRFVEYMSRWQGSFARIFTLIRGVLWSRVELYNVIELCGTAKDRIKAPQPCLQLVIKGLW